MPNINGSLVHLPGMAEAQAKARKARKFKSKPKKAYENFKNNRTSKPATSETTGRKFGRADRPQPKGTPTYDDPAEQAERDMLRPHLRRTGFYLGAATGLAGGGAAGSIHGRKKYPESKELYKALRNPFKVGEEPVHLITDMGTAAGRQSERRTRLKKPKRWQEMPKKSFAAGAALGAAAAYPAGVDQKKGEAQLVQQRKKRAAQRAALAKAEKIKNEVPKLSRHQLAYTDEDARHRMAARQKRNYSYRGPHGKENAKIQAAHTGVGTAIGAGAGLALSRGVGAKLASREGKMIAGGATAMGAGYGAVSGQVRRSFRAGKRSVNESYKAGDVRRPRSSHGETVGFNGVIQPTKKVNKSMTTSAFGIDHGEVYKAAGVTPMKPIQPPKPGTQAMKPKQPKKPTIGGGSSAGAGSGSTGPITAALSSQGKGFGMGGSYSVFKPPSISKAQKYKPNHREMTTGRELTGTLLPGYHGAVAGKGIGGKARSAGAQLGLGSAGSVAGSAVGSIVRKPKLGGTIGGLAGTYKGTEISHKKGWLKRQKERPSD